FKHSLQLCLAMCQYGADVQGDGARDLLKLIARKRVGNRHGRIEPRAIKQRPKPYPMLMQKRSAARAEIRKNGHPKKVK
ncbi:IS4 family transposase, partial [Pseudomonas orientalis]